jgi:hypothetical protein
MGQRGDASRSPDGLDAAFGVKAPAGNISGAITSEESLEGRRHVRYVASADKGTGDMGPGDDIAASFPFDLFRLEGTTEVG